MTSGTEPAKQGRWFSVLAIVLAVAGTLTLGGCENFDTTDTAPAPKGRQTATDINDPNRQTIFGLGGILGGENRDKEQGTAGGIGVNSFLWRASLDTLAFMPLTSADPFGGVIITDWYSPPETPGERFKLTVYILDRRLRADGLKVSVFRQVRDQGDSGWVDSATSEETSVSLENAILTRARQLRIDQIGE
ncbi:DUF3576 domain-containing protein [Oceanibacterium hippocampi]|uniref:DUF3576 domain-containing protein n=1 Tax=Oceanibacterium hippocampi TaxID=745714 RepID=A0A1Y5RQW5_9PROT|nr:DUF3576 domain-containing protein [Oceanibacterium hippocampi]SLN20377.1 hypothetical protein OCH7691_00496 [Oceanibacterium hippocampi]